MKRWKKYLLATSAVAGTGAAGLGGIGAAGYSLYQSADRNLKPEYMDTFTYDNTLNNPDKNIAAARVLYERINKADTKPHATADLYYDESKTPHLIAHTKPEDALRVQEFYAKWINRVIRLTGEKKEINGTPFGTISLIEKGQPDYDLVEQALTRYNNKFPSAAVTMPAFIVSLEKFNSAAGYMGTDVMVLGKSALEGLTEEEKQAIIIHELRHKAQFFTPVPTAFNRASYYNAAHHARFMGSDVVNNCKNAGLSDQDIENALPGHNNKTSATLASGLAQNDFRVEAGLLNMATLSQWMTNPYGMIRNNSRVAANTQCYLDIQKIRESQPHAVFSMVDARKAERRKMELDADMAAAKVVTPEAIANGMLKLRENITRGTDLVIIEGDHPSFETRFKSLGCQEVPGAHKEDTHVARCGKNVKKTRPKTWKEFLIDEPGGVLLR